MKSTRTPGHAFVRNVYTDHSNGGRVDLIELSSGQVLAINGECAMLCPSLTAYTDDEVDKSDFPTIDLEDVA